MVQHIPVMTQEVVNALKSYQAKCIVDCTFGGGGHTQAILKKISSNGRVIALDRDKTAIREGKKHLSQFINSGQLTLLAANFQNLDSQLFSLKLNKVDGVFADLGLSSIQIQNPNRGFSFICEGPLDMRMDQETDLTAVDIINQWPLDKLINIFYKYGEEPQSKRIARAIILSRQKEKISTTKQLVNIIKKINIYSTKSRRHVATKIFQALRIQVNGELKALEELLKKSVSLIRPGGRLVIITFHSLEDRIVKKMMQKFAGRIKPDPFIDRLPMTEAERHVVFGDFSKIIQPFPVYPSNQEKQENPRSRSAKLRVMEIGSIYEKK